MVRVTDTVTHDDEENVVDTVAEFDTVGEDDDFVLGDDDGEMENEDVPQFDAVDETLCVEDDASEADGEIDDVLDTEKVNRTDDVAQLVAAATVAV